MDRRDFLLTVGAGASIAGSTPGSLAAQNPPAPAADRAYWVGLMQKLADPVLNNLAGETLKQRMPVEQAAGAKREAVTHLEALGRLDCRHRAVAGTAGGRLRRRTAQGPLRDAGAPGDRSRRRSEVEGLPQLHARAPAARRCRVPGAGSAAGAARAARGARTRDQAQSDCRARILARHAARVQQLAAVLGDRRGRAVQARRHVGSHAGRLRAPPARPVVQGDGAYGDGPEFHFDYYNSFVIHPMLLDVLDAFSEQHAAWKDLASREAQRARRYAAVLERLIAPDGSFPAHRPLAGLPLRRDAGPGADGAAPRRCPTASPPPRPAPR